MSAATTNADSLSPALTVNDLPRSLKFYTEGLGFEIVQKHERDGKLQYVAMKAGNGKLGIGQDDFAKGRDRAKGVGMRIWIVVSEDINALAERAKSAGITLDEGPLQTPWGSTSFSVTDPDGFKISIEKPAPGQ